MTLFVSVASTSGEIATIQALRESLPADATRDYADQSYTCILGGHKLARWRSCVPSSVSETPDDADVSMECELYQCLPRLALLGALGSAIDHQIVVGARIWLAVCKQDYE